MDSSSSSSPDFDLNEVSVVLPGSTLCLPLFNGEFMYGKLAISSVKDYSPILILATLKTSDLEISCAYTVSTPTTNIGAVTTDAIVEKVKESVSSIYLSLLQAEAAKYQQDGNYIQ